MSTRVASVSQRLFRNSHAAMAIARLTTTVASGMRAQFSRIESAGPTRL